MKSGKLKSELEIQRALISAEGTDLGPLKVEFLLRSLSILEPRAPVCISEEDSLLYAISCLRKHKIGCVLVINTDGALTGIFSERDCILKLNCPTEEYGRRKISEFMTRNPVTQPPTGSIAYALNLMSEGGFRHIPIVDQDNLPIGIISVKDVVDYLVRSYTEALLGFDTLV